MAMLSVVEKLGHTEVTENIVDEHMASDRVGMLNVIGTKALATILKDKHYTTEEVMKLLTTEDFKSENVMVRVANVLNMAQEINQAQVDEED